MPDSIMQQLMVLEARFQAVFDQCELLHKLCQQIPTKRSEIGGEL